MRRPDLRALHEPPKRLDRRSSSRRAAQHAVTDEDHRRLRRVDDLRRLIERLVLRLWIRRAADLERRHVDGLARDILGELDVRGAGLLDARETERLAYDLGHGLGDGDAGRPLRDRLEHPDDVDVLVRLLVVTLEAGLTGDPVERRAIQLRVGDTGEEVRGAGAERREAHAGFRREAAEPP